jgi:hypothetical protein
MQPGQDWELDLADRDRNTFFLIHISTKKLK